MYSAHPNHASVNSRRRYPPPGRGVAATSRAFLDYHRDTLRWKCSGLTQEQLAVQLPPSDLTLGGIMKHVALVECRAGDHVEDMARRRGLVKHHLWRQPGKLEFGFIDLQDAGDQSVEMVIAFAIGWSACVIRSGCARPFEQPARPRAALDIQANALVKLAVDGFKLGAQDADPVAKSRLRLRIGMSLVKRPVEAIGLKAVKRMAALTQSIRFTQRPVLLQLADESLQRTTHSLVIHFPAEGSASGHSRLALLHQRQRHLVAQVHR